MHTTRAGGPVLLLLVLIVTVMPSLAATSSLDRGFLSVQGSWIVDSQGQVVILRGVNYPGYTRPHTVLHSEENYRVLAESGANVVRLPISWSNLEPKPGLVDMSLLERYVDMDIQWAKEYGIYIVLDMHQFLWASKFGGGGIPDWAVRSYPSNDTGLKLAVSDFWLNASLQDHLSRVWAAIAQRYANEPAVAGYDLFNEPFVYTSVDPTINDTVVDMFYARMIKAIRAVDSQHIIFLEPANLMAFMIHTTKNIVWSPHYYPLSFAGHYSSPVDLRHLESTFAAKYEDFQLRSGTPMWIGEFGAFMTDGTDQQWLEDATSLFQQYQVGWAWWAYYGGPVPSYLFSRRSYLFAAKSETISQPRNSLYSIFLIASGNDEY